MQANVLIARFPFQNQECPDSVDWLVKTVLTMKQDPRIGDVQHVRIDDTPITMGRNRVLELAKQSGSDYVLMLDSDMAPDLPLPGARPFWPAAFDFALAHAGPCVVGAPYCGPPPFENVYVFRWANARSGNPNADLRLEQYSREEAAQRAGFEEVAALPTGLILIDVRGLARLTPPYCYYEWTDGTESGKASTEDVTFTRDLSLAGVPNYCLWDAWAGHHKRLCVGKPAPLTIDRVRAKFVQAVRENRPADEKVVQVNAGRNGCVPRVVPAC